MKILDCTLRDGGYYTNLPSVGVITDRFCLFRFAFDLRQKRRPGQTHYAEHL
jgi:hypothetical protein